MHNAGHFDSKFNADNISCTVKMRNACHFDLKCLALTSDDIVVVVRMNDYLSCFLSDLNKNEILLLSSNVRRDAK